MQVMWEADPEGSCREGAQQGGSELWPPHLLGEGLQLVLGVDVLPDALHVIPVPHDTMLHGVAQGQKPPVLLWGKASVAEFLSCPALAPMESALHLPLAGPLLFTACPLWWVPNSAQAQLSSNVSGSQRPASLNWPGTREGGNIVPPSPSHASLHSPPVCSPLLSPHVAQVTICHSQLLLIRARSLLVADPILFPPAVTCQQLFPAPQPVLTDLPFDVPPQRAPTCQAPLGLSLPQLWL